MPKTITLDGIQVLQIRMQLDPTGAVRVFAEYQLKAGNLLVTSKSTDVTHLVSSSQQTDAAALVNAIIQNITAHELA